MTNPAMTKIECTAEDAGRVDKALARRFPAAGRKALARLFADGAVKPFCRSIMTWAVCLRRRLSNTGRPPRRWQSPPAVAFAGL